MTQMRWFLKRRRRLANIMTTLYSVVQMVCLCLYASVSVSVAVSMSMSMSMT